jgi:hypothetical protein
MKDNSRSLRDDKQKGNGKDNCNDNSRSLRDDKQKGNGKDNCNDKSRSLRDDKQRGQQQGQLQRRKQMPAASQTSRAVAVR